MDSWPRPDLAGGLQANKAIVGQSVYRGWLRQLLKKQSLKAGREGRLAYFRRLPDAADSCVGHHLVEKNIPPGLGKVGGTGGALHERRANKKIERGVAHLLEGQAVVVFCLHVPGVLVMHAEEIQEAQWALRRILVALVMLDQEGYFGKLMQVRVRQKRAYENEKCKKEDLDLQFI